jgi:hypothetical protein
MLEAEAKVPMGFAFQRSYQSRDDNSDGAGLQGKYATRVQGYGILNMKAWQ